MLNGIPAYRHLLLWENQVHLSAEGTLEQVFMPIHNVSSWENRANFLLNKLGLGFAGKKFNSQTPLDKIKSSLFAFNTVFTDSLEYCVNDLKADSLQELQYNDDEDALLVHSINKKLLFSESTQVVGYPARY